MNGVFLHHRVRVLESLLRRDAERQVALWALTESGKRLRAQLERDTDTLAAARDELARLLHHAAERGLFDLSQPTGEEGVREIWRILVTDPGTRSASRWLALRVALPDVLLLIDERIDARTVAVSGGN